MTVPEHIYEKSDLIQRFDNILGKTFGEIDNIGMFEHVQEFNLQKGVAGAVIEQCVLGYEPDTKQEADLIVIENGEETATELKTTGMVISNQNGEHFVAKEPMSITAVGVYDLAEQDFWNSHFWDKLEHMLIVYYYYNSKHAVTPYEYRLFPVKGYEFHEFNADDIQTLKRDWEYVHSLVSSVVVHHPGPKTKAWKEAVKEEYLKKHGVLRQYLSYIDLAPKFPPRFRLKKPVVSTLISRHFGYELEQLPGRYTVISDIDKKCREITALHKGKTIGELADEFGVPKTTKEGKENKSIAEQVIVKMFGGESKKLNQIDIFSRFGLIAKSVALTSKGGRTEDMKLYQIDFNEMTQQKITDEDGSIREMQFEDSELYSYFADHEFLCIMYIEPEKERIWDEKSGKNVEKKHPLVMNRFWGFKRLVFSDAFIDNTVKQVWEDTRYKIFNDKLEDVIQTTKDGRIRINKTGEISSAPNFIKSAENAVFIRGGANDSSLKYKTECINGVRMIPQFIWIKGLSIIDELEKTPLL